MEQPRQSNDNGGEKASPGVMGGAAAVGATVGAVVSGPLVALALGVGAAGLCLSDNKAGEVARSTGRAGVAVVDKGKLLYNRYKVGDKVKEAATTTRTKAKELDDKHAIVDRTKAGASQAWESVKEFDRQHRLSSRAGDAVISTMDGATAALTGTNESSTSSSSSTRKDASSSKK